MKTPILIADTSSEAMSLLGGLSLIVAGVFLYFLPAIVGREKRNCGAIFALNLFLGWTFVGWVVALVWAMTNDAPAPAREDELLKLRERIAELERNKPPAPPMFLLLAAALLAGCATPMKTASGRPEVTINAELAHVRAVITSQIINWGYSSRAGDTHNLVFEKDAGMAASVFLGSVANPQVIRRCRFTLIEQGEAVRVVAGFAMLSASTPREAETPGRAYDDLQYLLDCVRARCQGEPLPARAATPKASSPRAGK